MAHFTAPENLRDFESLLEIIRNLRAPQGCPWDREQTNMSLTKYAEEEVNELIEAIHFGSKENCKDELGDVLLQVVLHAQIYAENSDFDIFDVIENLNKKMVRRHPHVFGENDSSLQSAAEVSQNWQKIKAQESPSAKSGHLKSYQALSPLLAAEKIGHKTKDLFDWPNAIEVRKKVIEELDELDSAIESETQVRREQELGDLLFSVVQWARHLNIDPSSALRHANHKFVTRYNAMIDVIENESKSISELSDREKERYWQRIKQNVALKD